MIRLFTLLTGLFLFSSFVLAEGKSSLADHVAKTVKPLVKDGRLASVVVGVITPKGHEIFGFGKERDASKKVPDGDTIYMIGSVQKLFAGVMLAKMTREKKLRLDEPINELLPPNRRAQVKGRPITLVDLATHTSGLPANVSNAPKTKGEALSEQKQMEWIFDELHRLRPQYAPGTHYEYSNLGAVLLRDLLAYKAKMPYLTMVAKEIFEPLQMTSTFAIPPADAFERIAQGHNGRGKALPLQSSKNYQKVPVEQFYSTANDMIKFLEANMGLKESSIQEALDMTQVQYFQAKKKRGMGLFWHIRDGKEFSKNGHTGKSGFHSIVIFNRNQKYGVVVLSNSANGAVDGLGRRIFGELPKFF